jgi:hypothetical protein
LPWILLLSLELSVTASATGNSAQEPATADPGTAQDQPQPADVKSGGKLKFSRFHRVLGRNLTSNLFTRQNLAPFLIGAAGGLAIAPADQEISGSLYDHAREFGDAGQIIGSVLSPALVGGSLLVSRWTGGDNFRSFSYTLAQAYATNVILTHSLKFSTHRMRPDGSASTSFPSGHSSDAFTMATVVSNYYGKKWGIPLYALGGLIALSRIEQGRHWPSDAVAGAALGYIAGRTAILGTKREIAGNKRSSRVIVVPVHGHDYRGISVRLSY